MPPKHYEEVVVLAIVGIIVFLVITGLMVYILIFYQKKKFQHHRQLIEKEKEYSKQLLQSQLEIQELTFDTISKEIHDNVGQILSLAKVQLNIIDQSEALDRGLLSEAKESVSKAMTDLRDIAKSLNSERIQFSNLTEIARYELDRISRSGLMITSICVEGKEQNMPDQKKLIIFRIIQEALHNILKHSKAKNIDLNFFYDKERLKIEIKDNGEGFDTNLISKKDGLGLQNIINRASLIGAEAYIKSMIKEGTVITIISPYG